MNGKRSNRLSERSIKEIGEKDLSEEKERRLIIAKVIGRVDMGIGSIILEELMILMMIVMMIMIIAKIIMLALNVIMTVLEEVT